MRAKGNLFKSNVNGDKLWEMYLGGFENDPIFRSTESSVHNCNYCKSFIRRYGSIVAVDENYNLMSIFDIESPEKYRKSFDTMADLVKRSSIENIFRETFQFLNIQPYERGIKKDQPKFKIGVEKNVKEYNQEDVNRWPKSGFKVGDLHTFEHLFLTIPKAYVDTTGRSLGDILSGPRQLKKSI